jgi:NADH-quinone oxidoreductase subunit M
MNLSLILLIPLMTALLVLMARGSKVVRWASLLGSLLQVVAVIGLFLAFTAERKTGVSNSLLFEQQRDLVPSLGISFHLGVDGISIAMLLLTSLVVAAGVLISWKVEKMTKEFFLLLQVLALGAYGFFLAQDLFVLFFFLEVAVIPKYLLISIWGSGKKDYAANKLALMLMGASALVLVGVLGVYFSTPLDQRSFDMTKLSQVVFTSQSQSLFFPLLFAGFGVFTALFPFHTWVPDGHSSAPTAGSMFLAGISMKLGGYGALRVAVFLLPEGAKEYANIIIVLSSIAIIYGAFATMMQKDLKYMNAYSSISHCGFVLLGIGMLTKTAVTGAVLQMVSHGLMTALFFAVIGMIYERTHTRTINQMQGLLKVMPFTITVLFIAGLTSLGLPGFSGFVSEMTVFVGAWQKEDFFYRAATVVATLSIVVTAVYILRAVGQISMGPITTGMEDLEDAHWNEKFAAILLLLGILAIGLAPFWMNNLVVADIGSLLLKITGN